MNNLLVDYQYDILQLFKNHYRRMITKSVDVLFDEILQIVMSDLNIKSIADGQDTQFLKTWFNNVHHQHYFQQLQQLQMSQ